MEPEDIKLSERGNTLRSRVLDAIRSKGNFVSVDYASGVEMGTSVHKGNTSHLYISPAIDAELVEIVFLHELLHARQYAMGMSFEQYQNTYEKLVQNYLADIDVNIVLLHNGYSLELRNRKHLSFVNRLLLFPNYMAENYLQACLGILALNYECDTQTAHSLIKRCQNVAPLIAKCSTEMILATKNFAGNNAGLNPSDLIRIIRVVQPIAHNYFIFKDDSFVAFKIGSNIM
jgi:hypothetical protein